MLSYIDSSRKSRLSGLTKEPRRMFKLLLVAVTVFGLGSSLPGNFVQERSPVGKCPPVDGERLVLLPDSDDNRIFYMCSNGVPIKMTCAPGTIFDPTKNVCVNQTPTVFSPVGTCPPVDGWVPTFLPDSENPSLYYECRAGQPILMRCPSGLVFNPQINVCDWPKNPQNNRTAVES